MRVGIACCLLLTIAFPRPGLAQTAREIEQAIENLGAADFAARQAATDLLWQAGPKAQEALQRAQRSNDPEVRTRASALLNRLRLGIRPDTPPEVTALIEQFRFASTATLRRQALAELQSKGHWQAILSLIRGERDEETRQNLATAIAGEAGKLIRPLVERGDLDEAEQVLDLVAASEPSIPQLTAFLILTGRLETALTAARQKAASEPIADTWKRLAYLERAAGDIAAAMKAAEKSEDLFLRTNLLAEAGHWPDAAKTTSEILKGNQRRHEGIAFAATFYRLAGDHAEHERQIETLLKAAGANGLPENPPANKDPFATPSANAASAAWTAAEALLVNERPADALTLLRKMNPRFAHALLWRQHRHREALEYVNVTADNKLDRPWLDALPAPAGDANAQQEHRFQLAAQVVRQLRELGRTAQVQQILDTLRPLAPETGDRGQRLARLTLLYWQLGRYDDVPEVAVRAVAAGVVRPSLLASLLKQEGPVADFWFEHLRTNHWPSEPEKALAAALWIAAPAPPAGKLPGDWRELVTAAKERIASLPPPERAQHLGALGQTCEIRGQPELARQYYDEAMKLEGRLGIRAGDLALADSDWKTAAAAYKRAADATSGEAIATYLHGYCLVQSGEVEAGRHQMLLADITALAPEARLALAVGLQQRKLNSEAIKQLALVRQSALPDSTPAATAAQLWGGLMHRDQPSESAAAWEQLLLHVLNPSSNFTEVEGYLTLAHLIHKLRAVAAIQAGDAKLAAAELASCERLLPGDVKLTVDLGSSLDKAAMAEIAAIVVERSLAAHQQVIDEFPESATYFNNAAWICARTQRQLDRALALAEKAVSLSPGEASYHDTLAEVHFQRGDRAAAIAAATKAAELAPHSPLFATRLKHFQNDELRTLDSTED